MSQAAASSSKNNNNNSNQLDSISKEALLLQSKAAQLLQKVTSAKVSQNENNSSATAATTTTTTTTTPSSSADSLKILNEAIEIFQAAVKLDPKSSVLIVGNSHELFHDKKYSECIAACDEEIEVLKARRHQIESTRTEAREKLELSTVAVGAARQDVIQILKETAKEFVLKKKFGEALGVYECWAGVEPRNPTPHSNISFVYSTAQNWEMCVKHCDLGLELCAIAIAGAADPSSSKEMDELVEKLQKRKDGAVAKVGTSKKPVKVVSYSM